MEKKKSKNTWLWIILCLPTVFIIYYFITFSGGDIKTAEVSSVTVTLPDGKSYSFDKFEDIDFYVNMYLEADPLTAPVRDIADEDPITVLVNRNDGSFEFKLYPEINTNGCFFMNSNGEYFSVLSDYAKQLLQRGECAYVYGNGGYGLPTLMFVTDGAEEVIAPTEYSWQYKNIADTAVDYTGTAVLEEQFFSFYSNKDCAFKFSVEPDRYTVAFTHENGDAIDCTSPAELSFVSDTKVIAHVEALWSEKGKVLGGKAVYEFELLYDVIPSPVRRPASNVMAGEVIYASFRNLSSTETIRLETLMQTAKMEVVYDYENGYTHVMLPVALANAPGDYDLKFYMGDISETFTVEVREADFDFVPVAKDTAGYTDFLAKETRDRYAELLASWLAYDSGEMINLDEKFTAPTDGAVLYDFATPLTVNSQPYTKLSGIDYSVDGDDAIRVTKRGTIVYIAEDDRFYGNMVVVDHGYGILSHYYHLGELAEGLTVGDIITEGERIASGGGTGLVYQGSEADSSIVHFAISLNGVFVNPNAFFKNGVDVNP